MGAGKGEKKEEEERKKREEEREGRRKERRKKVGKWEKLQISLEGALIPKESLE